MPDGSLLLRTKGVPQGGVISPVLSNLFLHYVFDVWMIKQYPHVHWCRYADDGLVHCKTEHQAQQLLVALKARFEACELELHPEKTKIVYCKDDNRRENYPNTEFVFLGYSYRRRVAKNNRNNKLFLSFSPAVSKASQKSMQAKLRQMGLSKRADMSLDDIAKKCNPVLRGWLNYFGHYNRSRLYPLLRCFNKILVKWAMRKFKTLRGRRTTAGKFLEDISKRQPQLFSHWKCKMVGAFI